MHASVSRAGRSFSRCCTGREREVPSRDRVHQAAAAAAAVCGVVLRNGRKRDRLIGGAHPGVQVERGGDRWVAMMGSLV